MEIYKNMYKKEIAKTHFVIKKFIKMMHSFNVDMSYYTSLNIEFQPFGTLIFFLFYF
jgi:hypothetical protein